MNGRVKYLIIGLVVMGTAWSSHAGDITVNWSAFDVTGLALTNMAVTPVPSGNLIEIGTYTNTPSLANLLNGSFQVFATGLMGANGGGPGFWRVSSITSDAGFAGSRIYIVVYNGSTTNTSTQWGIFSSTLASWTFPTSPNSTTIDIEDLLASTGSSPTLKASAQIIAGSGLVYDGIGRDYLKLNVIPEPSTFALVGYGLLAAIAVAAKRHRR
jgi:hypothetical protein